MCGVFAVFMRFVAYVALVALVPLKPYVEIQFSSCLDAGFAEATTNDYDKILKTGMKLPV